MNKPLSYAMLYLYNTNITTTPTKYVFSLVYQAHISYIITANNIIIPQQIIIIVGPFFVNYVYIKATTLLDCGNNTRQTS